MKWIYNASTTSTQNTGYSTIGILTGILELTLQIVVQSQSLITIVSQVS